MIKNRLREILDSRGKTVYWLSKETGIGHDRLAAHYWDEALMIRYYTLDRICEALSVTPGELLVLIGPKPPG